MTMILNDIIQKSLNNKKLTRDEYNFILNYEDLEELINKTYEVRKKYKDNIVTVQILTNGKSGNCSEDCKYCAQSCLSKADIEKYSLVDFEKLLNDAKIGRDKQVARHCIGFSGIKCTDAQIDKICDYFIRLKKEIKTDICCSIGFLTEQQAIKLKNAGVNRINHNLNTGRNNYKNICTTHTYEERINNIKMLKRLGFELCCGGIIGLGETKEDIMDMMEDISFIQPESVPINFLIPIKGTPFGDNQIQKLTPEWCLKVLCLARLNTPKADIRCAAGREIYFNGKQNLLFKIVNSIFASGYLTADGQNIDDTKKLIESYGFKYSME